LDKLESSKRTREIEEFTNLHLIHPLAARLTLLLARLGVHPNWVSFAGMACGVMAGWAYYHYQDFRYAVAGFLFMFAWHVLDGVDGQLARLTNQQSEFGKIIDGLADNVTWISVYTGFGLAMTQVHGIWVWLLLAVAGVLHSFQAATYELQRQEYDYFGRNKESAEYKSSSTLLSENFPRSGVQGVVYSLGRTYARMQLLVARIDEDYRRKIKNALATRPDRAEEIRARYRQIFAPQVRTWSVMSSNYRTLAMFICAVFHAPLIYFFVEVLCLTPLSLLLVQWQKVKSKEFAFFLDQQSL